MVHQKIKCDECGKLFRVKGVTIVKGKFLCGTCRHRNLTPIQTTMMGKGRISLEDALKRIYEVRVYINKKGYANNCSVTFPSCLAEKFIRITLVNPEEVKNGL